MRTVLGTVANRAFIAVVCVAAFAVLSAADVPDHLGAVLPSFNTASAQNNQSPTADAGPDQPAAPGSTVALDGSGSTGTGITYSWSQDSGTTVALDFTHPRAAGSIGDGDGGSFKLRGATEIATFEVSGTTYAAVTGHLDDGVQILDLSDHANPRAAGQIGDNPTLLLDGARGIATFKADGTTYAAVTANIDHGVQILDLSDPSNPQAVGQIGNDTAPMLTQAYGIATFNVSDITYAAVTGHVGPGVQILNLSDPSSPSAVASIYDDTTLLLEEARGIDFFEVSGTVYAAVTSHTDEGVQILNMSDPSRPSAAGSNGDDALLFNGATGIATFEVSGTVYAAVAASKHHGVQMLQLTNSSGLMDNPVPAGSIGDGGSLRLAGATGIDIFEVSGTTYAAVTGHLDSGVQILNITNPSSPSAAGSIGDGGDLDLAGAAGIATFEADGTVYAAVAGEDDDGVQILQLTDSSGLKDNPQEAGSIGDGDDLELWGATGMATFEVSGTPYAAVAGEDDHGVQILNMSDPSRPSAAGIIGDNSTLLLRGARGIATFEADGTTYAAVTASGEHGVQILDLSDPSNPSAAGSIGDGDGGSLRLQGAHGITTFEVSGTTYAAVTASGEHGVQILDLSDPSSPSAAGSIGDNPTLLLEGATGIATFEVSGITYAAVAGHDDSGVQILQLTDSGGLKTNPISAGSIGDDGTRELGGATGITTFEVNDTTYAAVAGEGDDGVQILQLTDSGGLKTNPTATSSIDDGGSLKLRGATGIATFEVAGTTYAAVTGHKDHGVQILDLSVPSSPSAAGRIGDGGSLKLRGATGIATFEVSGTTYAAVAGKDDDGVQIISLADTAAPTFTAPAAPATLVFTLTVTDAASQTATDTVTVTVPAAPVADARGPTGIIRGSDEVFLDGSHSTGHAPLRYHWSQTSGYAVDLDFTNLRGEGKISLSGELYASATFEVNGNTYAAVLVGVEGQNTIRILQITDSSGLKANLTVTGNIPALLDGTIGDIATFEVNGTTYAAATSISTNGVRILDLSDPSSPRAAGRISAHSAPQLRGAYGVTTFEANDITYAAVGAAGGVQIINMSDPANPQAAGSIGNDDGLELNGARGITTFEANDITYAAVAAYDDDGVQILQLTDSNGLKANPIPAGRIADDGSTLLHSAGSIATFEVNDITYAAVTSFSEYGVQMLQLTDSSGLKANPTAKGRIADTADTLLEDPTSIATFEVSGATYAAVTSPSKHGIQILLLADDRGLKDNPIPMSQIADTDALNLRGAQDAATFEVDGILYAAVITSSDRAVQIVNLADPATAKFTTRQLTDDTLIFDLTVTDAVSQTDTDTVSVTAQSKSLTDAGPDQRVDPGDTVTLDGSGSRGQGTPSYTWKQDSAPFVTLSDIHSPRPTFTAPTPTNPTDKVIYEFRLVFAGSDDSFGGDDDTVRITVHNIPPIANAGPDRVANPGRIVTLDGSGSSDTDAIRHSWSQDSGTTVSLSNTTAVRPTFTAPAAPATLVFTLTVNDTASQTTTDTVTVTVVEPPVANAGQNQTVLPNDIVTLNGSRSTGVGIEYFWNQTSGIPAVALDIIDLRAVARTTNADSKVVGGAFNMAPFEADGTIYAAVAGYADHGVLILQLTDSGGLKDNPGIAGRIADTDSLNLKRARDVATFEVSGTPYAAVAGEDDHGVQILDLSAPSSPSAAGRIADGGSLRLQGANGIATFEVSGTTYAAVTANIDHGVQILQLTNSSGLMDNPVPVGSIGDDSLRLDGASGIAIFKAGGATYAAVAAFSDSGVQILDLSDPSSPSAAGSIGDGDDLELEGATGIATFKVSGTTYAAVTGYTDDGVQILRLTDDGGSLNENPTAAGSIADGGSLRLEAADGIAIFEVWGATYAAVAGQLDSGVQILDLSDPSSPEGVASIGDTDSTDYLKLEGASGIATFEAGGATYAAVIPIEEAGIQILSLATPATPTFTAPAAPATLRFNLTVTDVISQNDMDTVTVTVVDAPVANAGQNQTVAPGSTVTLDGSRSTGAGITYSWVNSGGTTQVDLTGNDTASPTFTAPAAPATLLFNLTVTDAASQNDTATVTVTVVDAPVAYAGKDQTVAPGSTVTLDGSGSTGAGPLRYSWIQSDGTPQVDLTGSDTASPTFTAPAVPATLLFNLTVTDATSQNDTDTITVIVPAAPEADAGPDQTVTFNNTVTLDGSGSTGAGITYFWSQTAGTPAVALDFIDPQAVGRINEDDGPFLLKAPRNFAIFEHSGTTYAAVADTNSHGVQILDLSDPESPQGVGQIGDNATFMLNGAWDIATFEVHGTTYAAVAASRDNGVQIISLADPLSPQATGQIGYNNIPLLVGARGIATFEANDITYAAVTSILNSGVQILNVSDPANPQTTGQIGDNSTLLLNGAFGIATFEANDITYAAVTAFGEGGVQILDLSDPENPRAAGQIGDNSTLRLAGPRGVAIFEADGTTYAAVAAYNDDGVQILNVSDTSSPRAVGQIQNTGARNLDGAEGITTFEVNDTTYAAVAAANNAGVQILDLSDPSNPQPAGRIDDDDAEPDDLELRGAAGIATFEAGGIVYAAAAGSLDGGVQILSLADAAAPTFTAPTFPADLQFTLTVTDAASQKDTDDVTVTVMSPTPPSHAFVTTWTTDDANQQIILPVVGSGMTISWGDGQNSTGVSSSQTHTYAAAATYTVSVTGGLERFSLNNGANKNNLASIEQWGNASWTSMRNAFEGASSMAYRASDAPDLSEVTSMHSMFNSASSFDGNLSAWNVSSVAIMTNMFFGASSFDGDLSAWDVSSVTSMTGMFYGATSFDGDLSAWDVSAVTRMTDMFNGASSFNGNISAWDVSAVTNMRAMFNGATDFDGNISAWDVSSVTRMTDMFNGATSFEQNLGPWYIAPDAADFDATGDSLNVTDIAARNAVLDNHNATYNIGPGPDQELFEVVGSSTLAFTRTPTRNGPHTANVTATGDTVFEDGNNHRLVTVTVTGVSVPDEPSGPAFVTTWRTDDANQQITLPVVGSGMTILWGDGQNSTDVTGHQNHTYANPGTYTVNVTGGLTRINLGHSSSDDANDGRLASIEQWGNASWTDMHGAFHGAENMVYGATDAPNLSSVTDMSWMFLSASSFDGDLSAWNVSGVTDMNSMFNGASSFDGDLSAWNVSGVTGMNSMFSGASSFNQPLNSWDVSGVTGMNSMFSGASSFNQPLNSWDVSGVTGMESMFSGASSFNQPLNSWDVSGVTGMSRMFNAASSFNQPLNSWDVSGVTGMNSMFNEASSFNQPLNSWDVSAVTSMGWMFNGASSFDGDLSAWNVSRVTLMNSMFNGASSFDGNVSAWNVSRVADMNSMFNGASSFNQPLNSWDVSAVTSMFYMFSGATSFNQPLNSWDVGAVTSMFSMFNGASSFDGDISAWDVSAVTDMESMFNASSSFNQPLDSWDVGAVTFMTGMFRGATSFEQNLGSWYVTPGMANFDATGDSLNVTDIAAQNAVLDNHNATYNIGPGPDRDLFEVVGSDTLAFTRTPTRNGDHRVNVTASDGTVFEDGNNHRVVTVTVTGVSGAPPLHAFVTTWRTTGANQTVTFPGTGTYDVSWGDGSTDEGVSGSQTHTYAAAGNYTVSVTGGLERFHLDNGANRTSLASIEQWGNASWTSMAGAFQGATNMVYEAGDKPDLSRVADMSLMFYGASSFDGGISTWDVSAVTDMSGMFSGAAAFNQPLNDWNTESVTDMSGMFRSAAAFNQPLNDWNTESVTDMSDMFNSAAAFNQPLNSWNVSAVTTMSQMFLIAPSFDGDVSTWDVSSVTDMDRMFSAAASFNRDISGWDVSAVTTMSQMLAAATSFEQNLGPWYITPDTADFDAAGTSLNVTDMAAQNAFLDNHNPTYNIGPGPDRDLFEVVGSDTLAFTRTPTRNGDHRVNVTASDGTVFEDGNNHRVVTVTVTGVSGAPPLHAFVTTWRTTGANQTVTFPGTGTYDVSWGDGSTDEGVSGSQTHTYATAGNYTVSVTGGLERINIGDLSASDDDKIVSLDQWGNATWTTMNGAFHGADNMVYGATDTPDLSRVTDMNSMFQVTSFNGNLSGWDVSRVTDMNSMFSSSSFNGDISSWNVSAVTDMGNMFNGATSFNQNISGWNVSAVTDMGNMFNGATSFNQNISGWDVSSVTYMAQTFRGATSFDGDISGWDVGAVTNTVGMFNGATSFNQPLNSWDVSAVTSMNSMFSGATSFNQDISGWDVSAAIQMNTMFLDATSFDQNLGPWYITLDDPDPIVSPADRVAADISAQNDFLGGHKPTYEVHSPDLFEVANDMTLRLKANQTVTPDTTYQVVINATGSGLFGTDNAATFPVRTASDMMPADPPSHAFVTTWTTDAANQTVTFPGSGTYDISWGDGMTQTGVSGSQDHTYDAAGNYTVSVTGGLERFHLNNAQPNAARLASVEQWGNSSWTTMAGAFYGAENMVYNAIDKPDLSVVSSMREMFDTARMFDGNLSSWDVASVTDMSYAFRLTSFNGSISGWDVSRVTDMTGMFTVAAFFNQDISSWDVSSVTDMDSMFQNAAFFNQDISSWDVSAVTDMDGMFWDADSFNQPLNSWDVSAVIDMTRMFHGADSFNQPLNSWDVSAVTDMTRMFAGASSFNGDLSGWDVSSVTDMNNMFNDADLFNQPLSAWDVSSVTNMNGMFLGADLFNQPLSAWNVSRVTHMSFMFEDASSFNQDISGWDVSAAIQMNTMFDNADSFEQNLGPWYITPDTADFDAAGTSLNVTDMAAQNAFLDNHNPTYNIGPGPDRDLFEVVGSDTLAFTRTPTRNGDHRVNVTASDGTVFEDGNNHRVVTVTVTGVSGAPPLHAFVTTWRTTGANQTVTFPGTGTYDVSWGDGSTDEGVSGSQTHTYAAAGNYTVSVTGDLRRINIGDLSASDDDKIVSLDQWGNATWTTMNGAFHGADNMVYRAIDTPDLSRVTDMFGMFIDATSFDGDISSWNVSSVTDMTSMFNGATSFNQDLSDWDVSSVTRMVQTFRGATSFDGDISGWDVGAVTNTVGMFNGATSFNQDISSWDVSAVTSMNDMFSGATSFNQDISSWDVSAVISMNNMFSGATSFNQDISGWDVSSAIQMNTMFLDATSFEQNLGPWYVTLDDPDPTVSPTDRVAAVISAQNDFLGGHKPTYAVISPGLFEVADGATLRLKANQTATPGATYQVVISATGDLFGTGNAATFPVRAAPETTAPDPINPINPINPDPTGLTITVYGDNPATVLAGRTYTDAGAECNDETDGKRSVTTTDTVNTDIPDRYTVTYTCTDNAGNKATATRTVVVGSNTPPTLVIVNHRPSVGASDHPSYASDAICTDAEDGNISNLVTTSVSVQGNDRATITYSCKDSDGNTAKKIRQVLVAAKSKPPTVVVTGQPVVEIIAGDPYDDAGATCSDDVDGTFNAVTRFSTVDTSTPGIYTVFYECTDRHGNSASDIRVVQVVPAGTNLYPVLTVPGSVTLTVGDAFEAPSATCTDPDQRPDDMDPRIDVDASSVDTRQVGRYTVFYTCTDSAGNLATGSLYVNVNPAP